MKLQIISDEMHPVYYEVSTYGKTFEIPEELWLKYREDLDNFTEALEKVQEYIDKQEIK